MENEVIERVARAMSARVEERITAEFAAKGLPPGWQQLNYPSQGAFVDESWPNYADQARAAIEAMRDHDQAMLDAGTAVLWPYVQKLAPGSTAVAVYEAMIDAALGRVDA